MKTDYDMFNISVIETVDNETIEVVTLNTSRYCFAGVDTKEVSGDMTSIKVAIALVTLVGINIIVNSLNTILGILHCPINVLLLAVTSEILLE